MAKTTLSEALLAFSIGRTPEEYEKAKKRVRRLSWERDFLIDGIEVLKESDTAEDVERMRKKQKRLAKVLDEMERLNKEYCF